MIIPELISSNKQELQQLPIEQAHTIPSSWYHSQEVADFENEVIFSNHWQYVCHTHQLSETGDVVHALIAGNPILVIRTKSGDLNAFYNVCKHRGGPLAVKKGTTTVLQCQYHGWTYLTDGSLRGIPDWNLVELFDEKDFGLEPVKVSVWNGLVFICLNEPDLVVDQVMNGIQNRINPINLSELKFYQEQVYEINCNWKVYVDNFLEGYHIPIVHPELAKLLDYKEYQTEVNNLYSLQHSPIKQKDNVYQANEGEAYYYFVFPNIMLNILPGRLQMNSVLPVATDSCKVIFSYFYDDIDKRKSSGMINDDLSYSDQLQTEDIEICEAVHRGLKSKAYDKGRFSVKRELGVYHFQTLIKESFRTAFTKSD